MNLFNIIHALESAFLWTLQTSLYATVLIALVFAVQFCFRKVLAPRWRYALSLLVVLRLALPIVPQSSWSIYNLFQHEQPAADVVSVPTPEPTSVELSDAVILEASNPAITPSKAITPVPVHARHEFRFGPLLKFVWLAGFVTMLAIVVRQHRRFVLESRRWEAVTDPRVLGLLDECRNVIGMRRPLKMLAATGLNTPALFGFWKPRLLMPQELLARLTDQELRHVFLHELLHLRRGDVLVNWAMIFLRAMHWFNPAVWLAFRRLRADQELACDAAVMARLDAPERRHYGATLIKLLEDFSTQGLCPGVVPFVTNKQVIKRRISMIAKFKPAGRAAWFGAVAMLVIVGLIAFTRAAERPKPTGSTLADEMDTPVNSILSAPSAVDPASPALAQLAQQLAVLNRQVQQQEGKVSELRGALQEADANSRNPAAATDAQTAAILQLNSLKVQLGNDAFKEEVLLRQVEKVDSERAGTTLSRIIPDPILTQLVQEKLAVDARLASLQSDKGAEHPEVKQAFEVRKKLQDQIAEQVAAIKSAQLAKIESLNAQLDNTKRQLEAANANAAKAAARAGEFQISSKKNALENAVIELQQLKKQFQDTQRQIEGQMDGQARAGVAPEVMRSYQEAQANLMSAREAYKQELFRAPNGSPLLEPHKQQIAQFEAEVAKYDAQYPGIAKASRFKDLSASSVQTLSVERDGTMKFGSSNEGISFDRLKTAFAREHEKDPNMVLRISADTSVQTQRISDILDAAKKAGISSISLQTRSDLH